MRMRIPAGFPARALHNSTATTHYWAGRTRRKKWPRWFRESVSSSGAFSREKRAKPLAGNKTEALQLCEQTNSTRIRRLGFVPLKWRDLWIFPAFVRMFSFFGSCFKFFMHLRFLNRKPIVFHHQRWSNLISIVFLFWNVYWHVDSLLFNFKLLRIRFYLYKK